MQKAPSYFKYYINAGSDGDIQRGRVESQHVTDKMYELSGMKMNDDVNTSELENFDSFTNYETGEVETYNIKLGAFVEIKGKISLEDTFESMAEIRKDLNKFCLDELQDFFYHAFVEVEIRPI